ncbi:MAG: hypothetical protein RSP_30290 [Rhodanobacter sp.]
MQKAMLMNLPATGLDALVAFHKALGFVNHAAFTDTTAANGSAADIHPVEDHGFMHGRDMAEPDGRIWGAMGMDPAGMPVGDARK